MAALAGCGPLDPERLRASAIVQGAIVRPDGVTGDAWVFLYAPSAGPPAEPAQPLVATAVSAAQLERTSRYVFGEVRANPYRLWGFIDVDQDFRGDVDVLAQPTAGDRTSVGLELNVQPGRPLEVDVEASALVEFEPPACRVETDPELVPLDGTAAGPAAFTLVADRLGRFDERQGFPVGLVDEDGDGRPDDRDGDRVPDLSLLTVLRWLPRAGENAEGGDVVVPLIVNPAPLLSNLGDDVGRVLLLDRLTVFVAPRAQRVTRVAGRRVLEDFGPPPDGEYELLVVAGTGQFWRLPNQLAGAVDGQGVRFRFERARP